MYPFHIFFPSNDIAGLNQLSPNVHVFDVIFSFINHSSYGKCFNPVLFLFEQIPSILNPGWLVGHCLYAVVQVWPDIGVKNAIEVIDSETMKSI